MQGIGVRFGYVNIRRVRSPACKEDVCCVIATPEARGSRFGGQFGVETHGMLQENSVFLVSQHQQHYNL